MPSQGQSPQRPAVSDSDSAAAGAVSGAAVTATVESRGDLET
jgi:hypothetical protein